MDKKKRNPSTTHLSQLVVMENLETDVPSVLFKEKDYRVWFSIICQLTCALYYLQAKFGLIHNDLYCDNVRIRTVPEDTVLYYFIKEQGVYMKVPTYGYVVVIIDFGRVYLNVDGKEFVSNDFQTDDPKKLKKPFINPSIDLIRFVLSLELNDTLDIISDIKQRDKLKQWIENVTKTNEPKINIIKELKSKENRKIHL